jgi:hypothetical protein
LGIWTITVIVLLFSGRLTFGPGLGDWAYITSPTIINIKININFHDTGIYRKGKENKIPLPA